MFRIIPFFLLALFANANSKPALVVIVDGATSCNSAIDRTGEVLVSSVARDAQVNFVDRLRQNKFEPTVAFGCFGPDRHRLLKLKSERNDFNFQITGYLNSHPEFTVFNDGPGAIPEQLEPFFNLVKSAHNKLSQDFKTDVPVYVLGHSYGGWAAMHMLKQQIVKPKILVTVDPISPVYCNSAKMKLLRSPAGCLQAPPEFSKGDLQIIRSQTESWVNVFQNQAPRIHSSEICIAENIPLMTDFPHHANTWKSGYAWDRVVDYSRKDLK